MELTLNVHSEPPGFTVIELGGEIDVYTAPKLRNLSASSSPAATS